MPTQEFLDDVRSAQDVFVWEAMPWEYYERNPKWYIWMAVVVVLLTGYGIFTENYLFAFIILLTAIILVLTSNEKPKPILIQIGHNGIVHNGKLHLFEHLNEFSIIYEPPEIKVLYVQPRHWYSPRLRIELNDQDPISIRNHLKQYLEENLALRDEHISDIVARFLRM